MNRSLKYLIGAVTIGAITASVIVASAQESTDDGGIRPNPSYDGRYAFARLKYTAGPDDPCTCYVPGSSGLVGWQHDYPHADENIMRIATDLTSLKARVDSSVVVNAENPEIMKYPILYLSEPGCWNPSEPEVKALRKYLLKGGFLIVDDFSMCTGGTVRFELSSKTFEEQIHRVLPEARLMSVAMTDPTLNEFFQMDPDRLTQELQRETGQPPEIHGIYQNNDPKKRLMVAANYNTVIHRSWIWEAQGQSSVGEGNESYKLGVNYLLYGFTH